VIYIYRERRDKETVKRGEIRKERKEKQRKIEKTRKEGKPTTFI
jgi:hypothetical protein